MDYRFAIRCWQDQAGSENAKANVFVDGTQVATDVEITATSEDTAQTIAWESLGLADPASDTSFDIKVVLTNEYYVDSSTDRNININGVRYLTKDSAGNYRNSVRATEPSPLTTIVTDFTDYDNYYDNFGRILPTAVTGDQIASNWWASRDTDSFYTIVVWGGGGDTGVTITLPVTAGTASE